MKRTVLESNVAFDGRIFKVVQKKIQREDGEVYYRDIVEKSNAVVVLALNENNEAVFVSEYRDAIYKEVLGLPAGLIDDNENPTDAVIRELKEETGIHDIKKIKYIGELYSSEGFTNESTYLYLARVNSNNRDVVKLDGDEQISVDGMKFIPFNKVLEMVDKNELKGKSTNYLVLMAERLMQKGEF